MCSLRAGVPGVCRPMSVLANNHEWVQVHTARVRVLRLIDSSPGLDTPFSFVGCLGWLATASDLSQSTLSFPWWLNYLPTNLRLLWLLLCSHKARTQNLNRSHVTSRLHMRPRLQHWARLFCKFVCFWRLVTVFGLFVDYWIVAITQSDLVLFSLACQVIRISLTN